MIIAEAGVNHNGRLSMALELCDAAKEAGADVVKFQTWNTDKLITKTVGMAGYQEKNTGICESQYDMLKRLELSYDEFSEIKAHCDKIGIMFASTADESDSLDFLVDLGIPFIKIGSGDIGNVSFLRYIGGKKLPVILSTGMSSLADVDISVAALCEGGARDITLLHCTTNYPCPLEEVNLNAMLTLRNAFHLPVGYSDHTVGTEVSVAAVSLGARVIEKHFTLDRNMEGPDHRASTEPEVFKKMVRQIRNIELAMGDGRKQMTSSEKDIKTVVTKRVVAKHSILQGEFFSEDNICVKRSAEGELASEWDGIIGARASRNYETDQGIVFGNLK
ncbi:MAG: N-acetylneuraminate synthase [Lachnoclostridium sp.]|nr:N-acetylneuraminate synthase [Lachnospira sp.]MCM1247306.1 N-acetylneuraminate synthase [Lachnoclostridium sp.]